MKQEDVFIGTLKTAGERITAPRLAIFRTLVVQAPIGLKQLIGLVRQDGVDRVTSYRTIRLFQRLGLVDEVGIGRNRRFELSEIFQAHHHHFHCTNCSATFDFDDKSAEKAITKASKALGFIITSHQLEVQGLCMSCT